MLALKTRRLFRRLTLYHRRSYHETLGEKLKQLFLDGIWKWIHGWCRARSSKPVSRMEIMRLVGSIPMHFRHLNAQVRQKPSRGFSLTQMSGKALAAGIRGVTNRRLAPCRSPKPLARTKSQRTESRLSNTEF